MFKKLIDNSAAKSPWLFHINAGSCNGCDIEVLACTTPKYDIERFGIINTGNPFHADILLIKDDLTLDTVIAGGRKMMEGGTLLVRGTYEHD